MEHAIIYLRTNIAEFLYIWLKGYVTFIIGEKKIIKYDRNELELEILSFDWDENWATYVREKEYNDHGDIYHLYDYLIDLEDERSVSKYVPNWKKIKNLTIKRILDDFKSKPDAFFKSKNLE